MVVGDGRQRPGIQILRILVCKGQDRCDYLALKPRSLADDLDAYCCVLGRNAVAGLCYEFFRPWCTGIVDGRKAVPFSLDSP